ncbi:hypothetical protein [Rhodoferax saidenbachensis]|uniref:Uncharacterized protein n=1 Tax=Rhodoferax saidenbachensis TaxID=1484693 RepID=A0ABU1ZS23_9BURK|nr:hypothetical protein [Rhodoferax saidenbachensis]MDR7308193.1 hypothetical protein [Rhodoferax saidenbachensis]
MASAAMAQTPYDKLEAGTKLDGKGISFSAFAAPWPLPPGEWLVVSKASSSVGLTGGNSESRNSVPEIVVALKSQDAGNPVELLMVTFTPDSVPIVWRSPACNLIGTSGAPFKDDFGTLPSGLTYGCARGLYVVSGNRGMVDNLAHSNNAINRDLYSGFLPYVSSISDSSLFLIMTFSADKGRRATYQMHVRAPSSMQKGNSFDLAAQAWVHETGLSIQAALHNKSIPIAPFPTPVAGNDSASETAQKIDNAVEITLPGKVLSGSLKLDESGPPMPLPPGQWKVAGRREVQPGTSPTKSSRVYLTLRNMDPNASIAAAWLVYDSKPYYYSQASTKCESKSTPILENYGTTPESPIASCGMANTFSKSFRQRVVNAKTTGTEWDKTNLAALIPYADGLPEAHTWIELRVGANDTQRLLFTLYTAQPATVNPDGKYMKAVRTWMEKSKDTMAAYLDGKPSSFPPYPDLVD